MAPHFAKWQLPDDLVYVDELPLTATGKVSKRTLRGQFADYVLPDLQMSDAAKYWIPGPLRNGWAIICRGLRGRLTADEIQRRSVQPDLSAEHPRWHLCAASQTPRCAAEIRPCGGPRIPGAACAARVGRAGREGMHVLCEDDAVIGSAFYIMDEVAGP